MQILKKTHKRAILASLLSVCIITLILFPTVVVAASQFIDTLTLDEATVNSPHQNRKIVHDTVHNKNSVVYKNFNNRSKHYANLFRDSTLYVVNAEIDEVLNRIKVEEHITYTNNQKESTIVIFLRVYPNSPMFVRRKDNVRFKEVEVNGNDVEYELMGTVMEIELKDPLNSGESVNIFLKFSEMIPDQAPPPTTLSLAFNTNSQGVAGYTDYGVFGNCNGIVSLGHWLPVVTPFADGEWHRSPLARNGVCQCFEPGIFKVNIEVDVDTVVCGSGIRVGETPLNKRDKKIVSYLAFGMRECTLQLSKQYEVLEEETDTAIVRACYLKDHRAFGETLLSSGVKALKLFSSIVGEYPYSELNLVESYLTNGAGGMEFPGLVTISSSHNDIKLNLGPLSLLLGDNNLAIDNAVNEFVKDMGEFVVAHEVAHQWWNVVVGNDSINNAWVDEALTNYYALIYYEKYYGEEKFNEQKLNHLELPVSFGKYSGISDKPLSLPSSYYSGSFQYTMLIYSKGPLFYDELRTSLGEETFVEICRAYFEKYKFKFADEDSFVDIAKEHVPGKADEIDMLFQRWVLEEHLYEDVPGHFIEKLVSMVGIKFPETINLENGLMDILKNLNSD